MKLIGKTVLLLVIAFSSVFSQERYSVSDKKAIKYFEEGLDLFQQRSIVEAQMVLLKAIDRAPEFVEAYNLLATAQLEDQKEKEAIENFKKAIAVNPKVQPAFLYTLGDLEYKSGEYEDAKKHLEMFKAMGKRADRYLSKINALLDNIDFALTAKAHAVQYEPKNMGPAINSSLKEYYPALTIDRKKFMFTRTVPNKELLMGAQEDIYIAENRDGNWQMSSNVGNPINKPQFNEGVSAFSADGNTMVFVGCPTPEGYGDGRQGFGSCDIFYTIKRGDRWMTPQNIGPNINTQMWETQPTLSADGQSLFFIRGLNRGGVKNSDIYVSHLQSDGAWSKAIALPENINSKGNEVGVMIHPDNQTLYFSSNGLPGLGGYDLYITRQKEDGTWYDPVNLGYPINTHEDESSLFVSPDGVLAYISSSRPGGYGDLDIYEFRLPEHAQAIPVSYLKGVVFDADNEAKLESRFQLYDISSGKLVAESFSNSFSGEFLLALPTEKTYALNVYSPGYLPYSAQFEMKKNKDLIPQEQNVPMQKISNNVSFVLKNVFFETASYDLMQESTAELSKLVEFLKFNPEIKVEIGGHTDNVGDEQKNQVLSENRAKSVVNFLIDHGVAAARLTYKGYGEAKPIDSNETEEGRANNRRTECQIVTQ